MAQETEQHIETAPTAPVTEFAPETVAAEAAAVEAIPAEPAVEEPVALVVAEAVAETVEAAPAPAAKVAPKKRGPKPKISATSPAPAPAAAKVVAKPVRGPAKAAASKLPVPARKARKVSAKPVTSAVVKPAAKAGLKTAKPVRASAIETPTTIKTKAAKPLITTIKETIMAKTAPTDFIASFSTVFGEFQTKAKTAYEKSQVALAEANDFAKGNVEAVVESSKILASGLQELSTSLVTESRSAFETLTAEVKDIAAVKSPNEFFSLQSALARKNFDTAVAQMTKSSEAMLKLATDAFSPLTSRVSIAVEKVSKAA